MHDDTLHAAPMLRGFAEMFGIDACVVEAQISCLNSGSRKDSRQRPQRLSWRCHFVVLSVLSVASALAVPSVLALLFNLLKVPVASNRSSRALHSPNAP